MPETMDEVERVALALNAIANDMEHAVAGGMSWISHRECEEFVERIRKIAITQNRSLWQPIDTAPKDGTWILIRGRNAVGYPMIPVVCAWGRAGSITNEPAWRDSASGRDMIHLITDVPPDSAADWMSLPDLPVEPEE